MTDSVCLLPSSLTPVIHRQTNTCGPSGIHVRSDLGQQQPKRFAGIPQTAPGHQLGGHRPLSRSTAYRTFPGLDNQSHSHGFAPSTPSRHHIQDNAQRGIHEEVSPPHVAFDPRPAHVDAIPHMAGADATGYLDTTNFSPSGTPPDILSSPPDWVRPYGAAQDGNMQPLPPVTNYQQNLPGPYTSDTFNQEFLPYMMNIDDNLAFELDANANYNQWHHQAGDGSSH
jgi:hypothetical protein